MRLFTLAFLGGILCLQFFSTLPNMIVSIGITALFSSILIIKKIPTQLKILTLGLLTGFLYVTFSAYHQLYSRISTHEEGKKILVSGYISSIPQINLHGTSFFLTIKSINAKAHCGKIKLTWLHPQSTLKAGDKWSLLVKVKKPYGMMNPGGFDYEAYALAENIIGNGQVIESVGNKLIESHWYQYPLLRLREIIKNKIAIILPPSTTSPWIYALTIGERENIDPSQWEILRNTGTNHLMVIAGLHLGFIALITNFCISAIWRRYPFLTQRLAAIEASAIGALIFAIFYGALSGFLIPTQRALMMLTIFLLLFLLKRKTQSWQAYCLALLLTLINNPFATLTESFWLSFGSVALIIFGSSGRLSPTGWWWKWGRVQWVMALGLIPLSIGLFQQCAFIAFLANSIAIPIVGFLVVPLCFLASLSLLFSETVAKVLLTSADHVLSGLWKILTIMSHLPHSVWYQYIPSLSLLLLAMGGVLLLLAPIGFPLRFLGLIWLLPLIFYRVDTPKNGTVWLNLLDVGQGLSVVIETAHHTLIFDTGPRLSANYDMGESVVLPFLKSRQIKYIDMLVVSHGDNDHIGGANSILSQIQVKTIRTSVPSRLPNAEYCLRGQSWVWDAVQFEILYPDQKDLNLNNDSSCVLKVSTANQQILLTGDIEKKAEQVLLQQAPNKLAASVLIAPHHGSKTSADKFFLTAVHPNVVLYPVGYRNRYHFPNSKVVEAYALLNVTQYNTAEMGAMRFKFDNEKLSLTPESFRKLHHHYWNN